MSLLLLLNTNPNPASSDASLDDGLLRALLDAVHKEDDRIGGQAVTRLLVELSETAIANATVESTIGFGENNDGANDAKFLINGEVIESAGRTSIPTFKFSGLTRGVDGTTPKAHPVGSLVFDLSRNESAVDRIRRGIFVDTATGEDLDTIGRNLGLPKCPGLTEEQWRRVIKAVAYLPKQTLDAFYQTLLALTDDDSLFTIYERVVSDPFKVFVELELTTSDELRGKFFLNAGEPALTTGLTTVVVDYPVVQPALGTYAGSPSLTIGGRTFAYPAGSLGTTVCGVYLDTPSARRGRRDGLTNFFTGGSIAGNTITLGSSPGPIGTAVIVDYTAFVAHYLAPNEVTLDDEDFYAYLADPLLTARCLLDHVRPVGVQVVLSAKL